MEVCLSHMTALRWLARNFNPRPAGRRKSRVRLAPEQAPDAELARELRSILGSSLPDAVEGGPPAIDVLVSSEAGRRAGRGVTCHLCSSSLPSGSFVSAGRRSVDLWVTSPELTYVQLAAQLDVLATAFVGTVLCSDFRVDEFEEAGVVRRSPHDEPLTSVARISAYLDRVPGLRGVDKARRALAFVRDGALSPPEAGLALAALLPPHLGGFSLGDVTLNEGIRAYAGVDARGEPRHVMRYPDIVIRAKDGRGNARMAGIDYDPQATHGGEMKRAFDIERRNQIGAARRLDHFTFSVYQVSDYDRYVAAMDQVRRALGGRRSPRSTVGRQAMRADQARRDLWDRFVRGNGMTL